MFPILTSLPTDLVQYQLLLFLTSQTASKLAKTAHPFFDMLRHKIYRTDLVQIERFIRQSHPQTKCIALCTAVTVTSRQQLHLLFKHFGNGDSDGYNDNDGDVEVDFEVPIINNLCITTLLQLQIDFNQTLPITIRPHNLHTLTFGNYFNQSLDKVTLPPHLHTLTFGYFFDQSLDQVQLPPTLHTLTFGYFFNQSLFGVTLPANLHSLTFGYSFNQSLAGIVLPAHLYTLNFGRSFKQSLVGTPLPTKLHTLSLGYYYDLTLLRPLLSPNLIVKQPRYPFVLQKDRMIV